MKNFALLGCLAVLIPGGVFGQEVPRFTFSGGAGFTTPRGVAGSNLDYGWNVTGGAGVNLSSHIGVMLDLSYNSMVLIQRH